MLTLTELVYRLEYNGAFISHLLHPLLSAVTYIARKLSPEFRIVEKQWNDD
jgi:hypothetical protein